MSYILVALGNPGEKYEKTRHNVGFILLEKILADNGFSALEYDKYCEGRRVYGDLFGYEIEALFPETYMNESGRSVEKFFQIKSDEVKRELVVIHDDVDLDFGSIKISKSRGAGGHNGIRSIIKHLKTKDFIRIRVGIASVFWEQRRPVGQELNNFVLGNFSQSELGNLEKIKEKVERALQLIVTDGIEKAMEEINQKEIRRERGF